jgi:hypothetical protein
MRQHWRHPNAPAAISASNSSGVTTRTESPALEPTRLERCDATPAAAGGCRVTWLASRRAPQPYQLCGAMTSGDRRGTTVAISAESAAALSVRISGFDVELVHMPSRTRPWRIAPQ